jgi:erythromycin esterase
MDFFNLFGSESSVTGDIKKHALPLKGDDDLQPLLDRIANSKIVMLGEASHGTHEYYTWRARISKRLIEDHAFNFIAVEGDWPDCYRLNRYIKGYENADAEVQEVLKEFNRWPTWMWANWETAALAEWLKKHNTNLRDGNKAGFYGLDVYSLWESMESIIKYLEGVDPAALQVAQKAFRCFEPYREGEGQSYAKATMLIPDLCKEEVVGLLYKLREQIPQYDTDYESAFSAEQNAIVAVNAEKYYRTMVEGGGKSWNLRDRHMADTLNRLLEFHGKDAKAIIWAHNTHIGDARATDMAAQGMFNIGELARKEYGRENVSLVGFGSYKGTVIAGGSWGAPMKVMEVPEGKKGSWEQLLHEAGAQDKILLMDDFREDSALTKKEFEHRAIGVVYHPQYEKYGNYVPSVITSRYDAFLYLDETRALYPLHIEAKTSAMPDTYPFGY